MGFYRELRNFSHEDSARVGVLLVNIGTPEAPTYRSVRRFLARFLSDRRVVDLPPLLWQPLLRSVILLTRPFRSAAKYRKIWTAAGSPLRVESQRLCEQLQAQLDPSADKVIVELGMSYSEPFLDGALARLIRANCRRITVVPLYPQYCSSTVGAVHDAVMSALARWRWVPDVRFVPSYHDHPDYIEVMALGAQATLDRAAPDAHVVMSFHGVPVRYITEGDPYLCHCQKMARLLAERLRLPKDRWSISFQSRFGPIAWLQPYTERLLQDLVRQGKRNVVILSPSFPVDCLETLEEIDIEYAEVFRKAGGEQLLRVPALNGSPEHAASLASLLGELPLAGNSPRQIFARPQPEAAAGFNS